jgi:hypothetical protein
MDFDWGRSNLSSQQRLCTAMDFVYPLRFNADKLQSLPDLSLPLDENDAVADIEVDVTPNRGSKSAGSALAIRGEIVDEHRTASIFRLWYELSRPSRGDP